MSMSTAVQSVPNHLGYWVDLTQLDFSEVGDDSQTWIQIMPEGMTVQHPVYGKIEFDGRRLSRFADNFASNVRGQDLAVNFDHKQDAARGGEAAGWFRAVEHRAGRGLFALVDWTSDALQAIKEGKWRYFSPEFVNRWVHPESQKSFNDVLFGGALTNTPFLKGMLPINMSELDGQGGQPVNEALKALCESLGITLAEDATDEVGIQAIGEKFKELAEVKPDPKDDKPDPDETKTPESLLKMAESDPALKVWLETQEATQKTLAEQAETIGQLAAQNHAKDIREKVQALSEGSSKVLPPAVTTELSELASTLPPKSGEAVIKLFADTLKAGLVELGERGDAGDQEATGELDTRLEQAAQKFMEEDKDLSISDAYSKVFAEDPALYEQYRRETLAKEGA